MSPTGFILSSSITRLLRHTGTPTYLVCELHRHQPLRAPRSGTTTTLHQPHASSDFHKHSLAVSAPATWNNIPASICDCATLATFKTAFKTHLFNFAYTSRHWLPSIGASDSLFRDTWRQLKKFMLIDWMNAPSLRPVPEVNQCLVSTPVSGRVSLMSSVTAAELTWSQWRAHHHVSIQLYTQSV